MSTSAPAIPAMSSLASAWLAGLPFWKSCEGRCQLPRNGGRWDATSHLPLVVLVRLGSSEGLNKQGQVNKASPERWTRVLAHGCASDELRGDVKPEVSSPVLLRPIPEPVLTSWLQLKVEFSQF